MGLTAHQRTSKYGSSKQDLPLSSSSISQSGSSSNSTNKKLSNLMPICIALIVIAEIAFLGHLDMSKNAMIVNSWIDSSFSSLSPTRKQLNQSFSEADLGLVILNDHGENELESCEMWLERKDFVTYSRDFEKDPIWISGSEEKMKYCDVGCQFGFSPDKKPDGAFNSPEQNGTASIHRSMESSEYYPENSIAHARRRGVNIVMTTSLSSDVPVGYFSWAEYDIMGPVQPKNESALAAAFISNCAALNFRLQALEALENANITIDSYGACHRNHDGQVDKLETLKRYKFSLAFENSNEEDYVTEKYFQALVAGSVPVVVGAPNIEDFSTSPGSILHIKELKDADSIAKTMKFLANDSDAYDRLLRWKYVGPSDSFKALVDMAAVHSSCRLCIHLATLIREKEENNPEIQKRPCKCTRDRETVYHIYVRERGRLQMESIFMRSRNLTLMALESVVKMKFESLNHIPIWKKERPESIKGSDNLKIYRIYPASMNQRQALYTFKFDGDSDLQVHIERNPCPKFEVIFV